MSKCGLRLADQFVSRLDHQLVLPLTLALRNSGVVTTEEAQETLTQILALTSFPSSLYAEYGVPFDKEAERRFQAASESIEPLEAQLGPFLKACMSMRTASCGPKPLSSWVADWARSNSEKIPPFGVEILDVFTKWVRLFYQRGEYSVMRKWLDFAIFVVLENITDEVSVYTEQQLYWGYLVASLPMLGDPSQLLEAASHSKACHEADSASPHSIARVLVKLEASVDMQLQSTPSVRNLEAVEAKTWLLHWAIWASFRYFLPRYVASSSFKVQIPELSEWIDLLDVLVHERNLKTVEYYAPHLTQYYAVLVLFLRKKPHQRAAVAALAARVSFKHTDPYSQFLLALFSEHSLENSLSFLRATLDQDFFIAPLMVHLRAQAQYLVFETFYRMHEELDAAPLAESLGLTELELEPLVKAFAQDKTDKCLGSEIVEGTVRIRAERESLRDVLCARARELISEQAS
ncbi:MAG: uncharacterized protein KVP18_001340 [Porospora cf. gigantea A]|nr:MAG: hypothetical protein KVP18_001340 [Porospora cf. gigantea A]